MKKDPEFKRFKVKTIILKTFTLRKDMKSYEMC